MLAIALAFESCEKNTGNGDGQEGGGTASLSVSGFAQKGQLIKGASVTAFALDEKMTATGANRQPLAF